MDGIKHSRQFAEIERLVSDYFQCHLAPVMSKTQAYLTRKQGEEMKEYSTSLGGILSMMASSAQPMSDPYQVLKVTGEWNSKKTEDYIEMCKEKISKATDIQQDLAYLAGNGAIPSCRRWDGNGTTPCPNSSAATLPTHTWTTVWNN